MNSIKATVILAISLGVLGGMSQTVLADEWDQKTIFTFTAPVEVPGQVLPPGTYVFKLADSQSDRNIVQVFSEGEKQLLGTFLAIPNERLRPAGKPIITFDERPVGSPDAVRAWFYPGENYGHQFVYPKPRAVALAESNNAPVPSMPAELANNTTTPVETLTEPHVEAMRQAPLTAQTPVEGEVEIAQAFVPLDTPTAPPPAELPTTGSDLPLIGLAGLLFLGTAGALKFGHLRTR